MNKEKIPYDLRSCDMPQCGHFGAYVRKETGLLYCSSHRSIPRDGVVRAWTADNPLNTDDMTLNQVLEALDAINFNNGLFKVYRTIPVNGNAKQVWAKLRQLKLVQ